MPRNNRSQRLSRLKEMAASDAPRDRLLACRVLLKEYPGRRPQSFALSVLRRLLGSGDADVAGAARKLLDRSLRRTKARETAQRPQEAAEAAHHDIPKHPGEPDWRALGLPDPRSTGGGVDLAEVRTRIRESGFNDLWWYLREVSCGNLGDLSTLAKEVDGDLAVRNPDGERASCKHLN